MTEADKELCSRAERICAVAVEPYLDVEVLDDRTLYAMRQVCEPLLRALAPGVELELYLGAHPTVPSALTLYVTRKP